MAYEGFFTSPNEDGTEEIVPMLIDPDSIWVTTNQSEDGSQIAVLSIHCSQESEAQVYISHLRTEDLGVDEDGYITFQMDPPPDTARLLGEVSSNNPVLRLLLGDGDDTQRFVLRHTEPPTEFLELGDPGLDGPVSMN